MARSLLADLRAGFAVGALALGLAAGFTADLTLRHAMNIERNGLLEREARRIADRLGTGAVEGRVGPVPESTSVDWWLLTPDGQRALASGGSKFLQTIPWDSVGTTPQTLRTDRAHLYSAMLIHTPIGTLWVAMDRSSELSVLAHFRQDMAVLLVALVAGAALLGHAIAKQGLRPLRRIRDETASIEAKDLHRRLDATHFPEELADLVTALNMALGRLEEAFKRLEAFSSDLAHELKTPLQNLRSEMEGLILRPRADLDLPEALGSLLDELGRLDGMADQMLFLARHASPGASLNRQPLAASALLNETAAFFDAATEEAGIRVRVDAPPGLLVEADMHLVRRALLNLMGNAVRHTPKGGEVALTGASVFGATELAVSDTGEGIPQELLQRVGDRFVRIDAARGRATGGAGLGLAIVKGIAQLHGGTFSIESRPGRGTTVRLRFPAAL